MPPAANNPPGGAAAADRGLLTVHDASPQDDATHQPSSSSSLASLPVRRESAPHLERYTRGHRVSAFAIARDPVQLQAAIDDFEALRYSASALAGRRSRQNLWDSIVQQARLGDPAKPTAGMVFAVVAVLRRAGYRSVSSVAELAVLTARLHNQPVPASVATALRDARRAATRGLGPPRQSAPLPVERFPTLLDDRTPHHPQGPLWPRAALVIGAWWVTREVELANTSQQDVTVSRTEGYVSILLSASKTDPTALGEVRTHKCACGSVPNTPAVFRPALCPYCTVTAHLERHALRTPLGISNLTPSPAVVGPSSVQEGHGSHHRHRRPGAGSCYTVRIRCRTVRWSLPESRWHTVSWSVWDRGRQNSGSRATFRQRYHEVFTRRPRPGHAQPCS